MSRSLLSSLLATLLFAHGGLAKSTTLTDQQIGLVCVQLGNAAQQRSVLCLVALCVGLTAAV